MSQPNNDGDDDVVMLDSDDAVESVELSPSPPKPARHLRGTGPSKCPLCGYGAATPAHRKRHMNSRLCKRLQRTRGAQTGDSNSDSDDIEEVDDIRDARGEEDSYDGDGDYSDADGDYGHGNNEKDDHSLAPSRKRARRSSSKSATPPPKAKPFDMAHLLSDLGSLKEAIAYERGHNVIVRRRIANTQARERANLTVREAERAKAEAEEEKRAAEGQYTRPVEDAHHDLRQRKRRLQYHHEIMASEYGDLQEQAERLFYAEAHLKDLLKKDIDEQEGRLGDGIRIEVSFSMKFVRDGVPVDVPPTLDEALTLLAPRFKGDLEAAKARMDTAKAEYDEAKLAFEESDKKIEMMLHEINVASEKIYVQNTVISRANRTLSMLADEARDIDRDEQQLFTEREANNTGAFGQLSENARHLVRQLRANPGIMKEFCGIVDEVKRAAPSALVNIAPFVLNDTVLNRAPDHTINVPQDVCSICYIDLHDEAASASDPVVHTPCRHYFHASCFNGVFLDSGSTNYSQLADGLASSGKCPTCRANVVNTDLVLVPEARYFF